MTSLRPPVSQSVCSPLSLISNLSKLETWTKLSSRREGNEWHQREVHSDPQRILWFNSAKSIGSEWLAMIGSEYRSVWPSLNLYGFTASTPTVIVIGPVTLITIVITTTTTVIVCQKKYQPQQASRLRQACLPGLILNPGLMHNWKRGDSTHRQYLLNGSGAETWKLQKE